MDFVANCQHAEKTFPIQQSVLMTILSSPQKKVKTILFDHFYFVSF